MAFQPTATKALPSAPIHVPNYVKTGNVQQIQPSSWFGSTTAPTFWFEELQPTDGTTLFDPAKLTPDEARLAVGPDQGTLLGWIAVPAEAMKQALNSGQGKLYVEIDGNKYATSLAFDTNQGNPGDFEVVGVYTGKPDITGL